MRQRLVIIVSYWTQNACNLLGVGSRSETIDEMEVIVSQEMRILKDLNAFEHEVDEHVQEIGPKVTVY
jgi:hypothetical protein